MVFNSVGGTGSDEQEMASQQTRTEMKKIPISSSPKEPKKDLQLLERKAASLTENSSPKKVSAM